MTEKLSYEFQSLKKGSGPGTLRWAALQIGCEVQDTSWVEGTTRVKLVTYSDITDGQITYIEAQGYKMAQDGTDTDVYA